jgi:hypothetical protein
MFSDSDALNAGGAMLRHFDAVQQSFLDLQDRRAEVVDLHRDNRVKTKVLLSAARGNLAAELLDQHETISVLREVAAAIQDAVGHEATVLSRMEARDLPQFDLMAAEWSIETLNTAFHRVRHQIAEIELDLADDRQFDARVSADSAAVARLQTKIDRLKRTSDVHAREQKLRAERLHDMRANLTAEMVSSYVRDYGVPVEDATVLAETFIAVIMRNQTMQ